MNWKNIMKLFVKLNREQNEGCKKKLKKKLGNSNA